MHRPRSAILLAGNIRRTRSLEDRGGSGDSHVNRGIDVPVMCLPVGRQGLLLDAWLNALATIRHLDDVRVVVVDQSDVEAISSIIDGSPLLKRHSFRVLAEPASWRGAAGIVRDVSHGLDEDAIVIACEARRLPPENLAALVAPFESRIDQPEGVVGLYGADEPAGVYAFTHRCVREIPSVGYHDLKEQFLPAMASRDVRIVTAQLSGRVRHVRDRQSYLQAVRESLQSKNERVIEGATTIRASREAFISPNAVLTGTCIVENGAVIEDGAIVHDSVVLWGATVGGGAVVSNSVVGPLAVIAPREQVVRRTLAAAQPDGTLARSATHSIREQVTRSRHS